MRKMSATPSEATNSRRRKRTTRRRRDPSSTPERVAVEIRKDIAEGRLAPGERLTEAVLTKRFAISRGALREALSRLLAEGVLTAQKNRSVRVRQLTRDDFVHILEVREFLEGLAARLVATSPEARAGHLELVALYRQMHEAAERNDFERYVTDLYGPFHVRLVELAGNPLLRRLWEQLNLVTLRQQFKPAIDLGMMRVSDKDHGVLIRALLGGDADTAEAALRRHIAAFTERVRRAPDRVFAVSRPVPPAATRQRPGG